MTRLSWISLVAGSVLVAGTTTHGQQLLMHDVEMIDSTRADLIVREGTGALDPFQSALDRIELEAQPSPELGTLLDVDETIDLVPLLASRGVGLSEGALVGYVPSLKAVFYRVQWEEAKLIKAFLAKQTSALDDDVFVDGQLWIYRVPVTQMRLDYWRRPLTLHDLEIGPEVGLVRYDQFSVKELGRLQSDIGVIGPPAMSERQAGEDLWGFGGFKRMKNPWSISTFIHRPYDQPAVLDWSGLLRGKDGDFEWRIGFDDFLIRAGETRVFSLGFQRQPQPHRWIGVVRFGESQSRQSKVQRLAIRRWRSLNPEPAEASDSAAQSDLQLQVFRAPGNLMKFVDPGGHGFPPGYDPAERFVRSGVRPEIFGGREVLNLGPFLRVGGAEWAKGSEAWLLPEPSLLFVRGKPNDVELIQQFLLQLAKAEIDKEFTLDVGCWLNESPAERPTPDFACAISDGSELAIGSGTDDRRLNEDGLDSEFSNMRRGLLVSHNVRHDLKETDPGATITRVEVQAKFPNAEGGDLVFHVEKPDLRFADGTTTPQDLTLTDQLGSGQQLLVRFYPKAAAVAGDNDAQLRIWQARWRAVFE